MIKVIKCFKGATHVDKFNKRYKAKTTFIIKQTPFRESLLPHEWNACQQEHLSRAHQVDICC